MAFKIIRAVPRSLYNLSAVPAGSEVYFHIAVGIDVSEFTEITAYVRVHPGTVTNTDPAFLSIFYATSGATDEDPGALTADNPPFVAFETFPASTDLSVGLSNSSGFMQVTALPTNIGSLLNLYLIFIPSLTTTFQIILSLDLICKNSDPGPDYFFGEEREPLLSEVMD